MTKKQKFWTAYFTIAVLFAIYSSNWGPYHYKGFFFNLGRSLVWPAVMFPVLGNILGAIILVVVIILILAFVQA